MTWSHVKIPLAYGLFAAAGAAGLGWQIIWARMFLAGLGHEMPALTCVVAAFMGGIAIGAIALDRWIGRSRHPVRWFAGLLAVAGFWGILTVWLIPWMNRWIVGWLGVESASWLEWWVAITVPTVVLLPATAAMGASFAAMERVVAALTRPGRHVAGLYAANTFGAALGVILVTVWLLPALGLAKSAVMLSVVAILGALLVFGLKPDVELERSARSSTEPLARRSSGRRVLVTLGFTGLLGIGYELLVVRVLSQIFENTIYTYAAVLTVFLVGTALGAAAYRRFLREPGFATVLIGLCGLLCAACLTGIGVLGHAEALMRWLRLAMPGTVAGRAMAEGVLVAMVLLPATVVMGAVWSHLVQAARRPEGGIGAAVGVNAVGCGLAPIVFGVVLLPRIGARWTLILIALGYLALAPRPRRGQWVWLVAPLALLFWMPSSLRILEMPPGAELLAWRESLLGSIAVVREPDQTRTLRVDNRFQMGGTGSTATAARHTHLAMLQHSAPRRALVLGVGTGLTFGAATLYPGLTADGVELVPEIVELMPLFEPENRQAGRHPQLVMHTADARHFVVGTRERYDVVIGDLFHPARDGAALLYTREHFAAIRDTLTQDGIFCQWLPVHQMGEESLRMIVRTFLDVFPESHAWLLHFNVEVPVVGLVGGLHPIRFDSGWIEKRSSAEPLHAELRAFGLADSLRFFGHWLAGPHALRSWSGDGVLNTDDHPRVLFLAPRDQGAGPEEIHRRLGLWLGLRGASGSDALPDSLEESAVFANSLRAYLGARDEYLAGLIHESEGRREQAVDAFIASARRSREFTAGYARCLTLAGLIASEQPAVARALLERLDNAQPAIPVARQMLERLDSR